MNLRRDRKYRERLNDEVKVVHGFNLRTLFHVEVRTYFKAYTLSPVIRSTLMV